MSSSGAKGGIDTWEPMWKAEPLADNTWLIPADGCTSYLVVGEERGLLIDTGFGTGDIRSYAESLTDKPVPWVANTHGHFDHSAGNGWFDLAHMSAEAVETANIPYPSKRKFDYPLDYPIKTIGEGDTIDLGGRTLEVIEVPAHSPSSLVFLDSEARILFTGDEAAPFVMLYWQQEEPQPSVEVWARNMEKLVARKSEFDHVCCGHGDGLLDGSLVDDCLENARRILSGIEGEQMVLSEDRPEDFVMFQLEYMRVSKYEKSQVGYDVRYVHDREPTGSAARR